MNSSHTPGPFTVGPTVRNPSANYSNDAWMTQVVATHTESSVMGQVRYFTAYGSTYEQSEANARLIAAAPELLAHLKTMTSRFEYEQQGYAMRASEMETRNDPDAASYRAHANGLLQECLNARAAIAKATQF